LFQANEEFFHRDIYVKIQQIGPKLDDNHTIISGKYEVVLEIDDKYADEFMDRIEGV
jgi:hypothetical protein